MGGCKVLGLRGVVGGARTLFELEHRVAGFDITVDELQEHVEAEDGVEEGLERGKAIDPIRHLHGH